MEKVLKGFRMLYAEKAYHRRLEALYTKAI